MQDQLKMCKRFSVTIFAIFGCIHFLSYNGNSTSVSDREEYRAPTINSNTGTLEFTNMVIENRKNGYIYIGGQNRLFQLDSNLKEVINPVETGPKQNNIVCECEGKLSDNFNKLLIVDYHYNRVIVCGSVEQGSCELRRKDDLSVVLRDLDHDKISAGRYHVAASGNLSTVGFLASSSGQEYLFVGSSKIKNDEKNLEDKTTFYTLSKRSIPEHASSNEMFSNQWSVSGLLYYFGIKMKDKDYADKNYRVTFISGFAIDLTGYFVTTHPTSTRAIYQKQLDGTYISQVCLHNEFANMDSYLELPLRCDVQGLKYTRAVAARTVKVGTLLRTHLDIQSSETKVVFISFVQADASQGSAVCMFTISEIERKFVQLCSDCMENSYGYVVQHIPWIMQDGVDCNRGKFNVQSPVCSSDNDGMWKDVVQHLQGNVFEKSAVFVTTETVVSAIEIAVTENQDHTVGFFGTENGKVLKVRLDSNQRTSDNVKQYDSMIIDPNFQSQLQPYVDSTRSVKSVQLSYGSGAGSERFYVMTPAVIVGLPLFDCSKYETCAECLNSNDPFCGWCTLENKCSSSRNCQSSNTPKYFEFLRNGQSCPSLSSDDPLILTVSVSEKMIQLKGHNVPSADNLDYKLQFGDFYSYKVNKVTELNNDRSIVQIPCVTPPRKEIPKFPVGQGYLSVPLKLVYKSGVRLIEIARTSYTFYNCSVYSSCIGCVSSRFDCSWCLEENLCTHQSNNFCPQRHVKTSNSCPQITRDNEISLAQGSSQNVRVAASMLLDEWNRFSCEVDLKNGEAVQVYTGIRDSSSIVCQQVVSKLPTTVRSVNASLRINTIGTGPKIEIDNPYNVTIEIFRCDLVNDNSCGKCLESPVRWRCGWCKNQGKCTYDSQCERDFWLETSESNFCPLPQIDQFTPEYAAYGGNTTIYLKGVNFNKKMRVSIDTFECHVLSSDCCHAKCVADAKIRTVAPLRLCITRNGRDCLNGPDYSTTTKKSFHFINPTIDSFHPTRALTGWGTLITIKGEYLNAGNSAVVTVASRPCTLIKRTPSSIECQLDCSSSRRRRDVTSRVLERLSRPDRSASNENLVRVSFDHVEKVSNKGSFSFASDVRIDSIQPRTTIRSGGLPLHVTGVNLNLIQNPQLVIAFKDFYKSDCTILNSSTLRCPSPNLYPANLDGPELFSVAVTNKKCNHFSFWNNNKIMYDLNPVFDKFDGDDNTKIYRAEPIYITGNRFCPEYSCDPKTAQVFINIDQSNQLDCNVTRLDMDQITCLPPPAEIGTYTVQVRIGGYEDEIGYLKYDKQQDLALPIIIVAVVVVIIIISVVCFVLRYRKRANAKDEQLKKKEIQLNEMEAQVAKVCKEGFAELQTLIADEDNTGGFSIPFLAYRKYILRVLFPDQTKSDESHKLLSSSLDTPLTTREQINPRIRMSLSGLNRLVSNKTFLIVLIRTLENQKTFSAKDRGRVAALILIILHDRLDYATDILEHLLADLIRRDLETKKNPKILFRRSETVAEKMLTHWFSIMLHGFVAECVGEPFYTLFRAIKQQVNKGPVDAFTNEARYSLSEDKLLRRRSIVHENINLCVLNYLASRDKSEISVKVLTCDSISQVKQKILDVAYMNVPYSDCPRPENLDIVLNREKLTLQDEDNSSVIESDWKQINTLAHYKVVNNDQIDLIPKTQSSTLPRTGAIGRNGSGARLYHHSPGSSTSSLIRNKQASRSATPTLTHSESKVWHLVMPSDHDQSEGTLDRTNKLVSEIYLTTLLTTKGTLQRYVDNLFETIFSVTQRGHDLPLAVKHLFDFLDQQASMHGITDPEIVHTWKSNCLPLRFWVNLIKNPEFVFDIHKSAISDCFLSVIAQAFMDSCSATENELCKDSPSNKLLYAKDIKNYRQWVSKYYYDIKARPRLNRRDVSAFLTEQSRMHCTDFNVENALTMLYKYIDKYNEDLLIALDQEPEAKRMNLYNHFVSLKSSLNGRS